MAQFDCWVGHTDDNLINVLYAVRDDTEKTEIRALTKYIRQGNVMCGIRPEAKDEIGKSWGDKVSEKRLRELAFPPDYDPGEDAAARIAERLVAERRAAVTA